MLRKHLKVAVRGLIRQKRYALLNVVGLSLGLAGVLLMGLYVRHEASVDDFHAESERIVRLNKRVTPAEGGTEFHAITSGAMGPALAEEMPEIEAAVRVLPWFQPMDVTAGENTFEIGTVLFADASFFDVFSFPLERGSVGDALDAPRSIVLTASTAARLFGASDPVGQTVTRDRMPFTVTAVAEDPPPNSHLSFDAVISWKTTVPGQGALEFDWLNNWITQVTYTYLVLQPGADRAALAARLPAFMERHLPERADEYHLYLQPLADIYLGSANLQYTRALHLGSRTYVRAFAVTAVLLLIIAGINVTNLGMAQALRRVGAIGVRKALGAGSTQVAGQLLAESLLLSSGATIAAFGIAYAASPAFSEWVQRPVSVDLGDPGLLAAAAGGALVAALLSGGYPAVWLARQRAATALRGRATSRGLLPARRLLLGVQLIAAVVLLSGTAIVYQQVQYATSKDLGFDDGQILTVEAAGTAIAHQYDAFKDELLRHPQIQQVSASGTVPGRGTSSYEVLPDGRAPDTSIRAEALRLGDPDFVETYGLQLVAGRSFSADRATDRAEGVIVNETLLRTLGWNADAALGRTLGIRGERENAVVIGVVADFHLQSLRQAIAPAAMWMDDRRSVVSIRIEPPQRSDAGMSAPLDHVRSAWTSMEARTPFTYTWMDDAFAEYVTEEQRLASLLGAFAGLCLIVACLGLLGLVAYTASRREREIGIRKAVGASASAIVGLLTREIVVLSGIAVVVGSPVAYVLASRWMESFAYRAEIGVLPFVLAGVVTLGLAFGTSALQAHRAARIDPVRSLRRT